MNSLGSTATLAQAMTAAGRPCPAPGFQAHHIVPQSDPRAEEARQLLRDHGISIDAEVNGAWLAGNLETPEPNNMTPHEFTFREDYFEALNAKLSENQEASRSQVEKMLREIREHLEKGDLL